MAFEDGLDDGPLNAPPAAVHQTDFAEAGGRRGSYVLVDDRRDVSRREGVEVQLGLDGDVMRHGDWLTYRLSD